MIIVSTESENSRPWRPTSSDSGTPPGQRTNKSRLYRGTLDTTAMTPNTRRNLYVDVEANPQGVGIGLTLLIEESRRLGSKEAWLVCPLQTQLDERSHIGEILGKTIVGRLRRRQPVHVDGVKLVAYTERQIPDIGNGSPLLAVHTDSKLLDKLDALSHVPSLIVVPWAAEADVSAWRLRRVVKVFRRPEH